MSQPFFSFVLDSVDAAGRVSLNHLLKFDHPHAISNLESWFERMLPGKKATAVCSGRFGLAVLLEHLARCSGVRKANVVIPGFSCVVVSNAVRAAGCDVRYADVSPDTLNISLETTRALVDENTIAIVVQHVFGLTDRKSIDDLRAAFPAIAIIEDCAHALGGKYPDGEFVGAAGDYAFYSFEQSKMVTAWTGGVVVGKSAAAIDAVRVAHRKCRPANRRSNLRLYTKLISYYLGYRKSAGKFSRLCVRVVDKLLRFEPSMSVDERRGVFDPYALLQFSAGQAACVLDQLQRIDANVAHRQRLAEVYGSMLASNFQISPRAATLRYPLRVANKPAFVRSCAAKGVAIGEWFSTPMHPCDPNIASLAYRSGSCPHGEDMARHLVNLPTALQLSVADAQRIAEVVLSVEPRLANANVPTG